MKENNYYNNNGQRKISQINKYNTNHKINSNNNNYLIDFSLQSLKNEIKDMSETLIKLNKQTNRLINNKIINTNNSNDFFYQRNKKNDIKNHRYNSMDGNININNNIILSTENEYNNINQSINNDINTDKYYNGNNYIKDLNHNKLNYYKNQIIQKNKYIKILEQKLNKENKNQSEIFDEKNKMNINDNKIKHIIKKNKELIGENEKLKLKIKNINETNKINFAKKLKSNHNDNEINKYNKLKKENEILKNEYDKIFKENVSLKSNLDNMNIKYNILDKAKNNYDDKIDELNGIIEEKNKKLEKFENIEKNFKEIISTKELENKGLLNKIKVLEKQIEDIKKNNLKIDEINNIKENKINELNNIIKSNNKIIYENKNIISNLKKENDNLIKNTSLIDIENNNLKEEIKSLNKINKEKENQNNDLLNQIKISKLENDSLSQAKEKLKLYEKQLNEKDITIQSLDNTINDLTKEFKNKITENEDLKEQIKNLQNQIERQKNYFNINNINSLNSINIIKPKEKKHIKINLDNNDIYSFMQNELISFCLYKKGENGEVEQYEEKDEEKVFNKNVIKKKCIKNYNKSNIKINKNYILCENLAEEEIIPELYEDNDDNLDERDVNELANSLRCSVDKSINNSINASIRKSFNQSYADGIYDSINGSKLKLSGGKGILSRLNQVFGSVVEDE